MEYVLGLYLGVRMPTRRATLATLRWLEYGTPTIARERVVIAGGGSRDD